MRDMAAEAEFRLAEAERDGPGILVAFVKV